MRFFVDESVGPAVARWLRAYWALGGNVKRDAPNDRGGHK